jgi:hypothetical protein
MEQHKQGGRNPADNLSQEDRRLGGARSAQLQHRGDNGRFAGRRAASADGASGAGRGRQTDDRQGQTR